MFDRRVNTVWLVCHHIILLLEQAYAVSSRSVIWTTRNTMVNLSLLLTMWVYGWNMRKPLSDETFFYIGPCRWRAPQSQARCQAGFFTPPHPYDKWSAPDTQNHKVVATEREHEGQAQRGKPFKICSKSCRISDSSDWSVTCYFNL